MKGLSNKEVNELRRDIDHILDSGVNSIRLLNMIDVFLWRRGEVKNLTTPDVSVPLVCIYEHDNGMLTVGREYKCIYKKGEHICVISDNGELDVYHKTFFI